MYVTYKYSFLIAVSNSEKNSVKNFQSLVININHINHKRICKYS